jgi:hypothetical protein
MGSIPNVLPSVVCCRSVLGGTLLQRMVVEADTRWHGVRLDQPAVHTPGGEYGSPGCKGQQGKNPREKRRALLPRRRESKAGDAPLLDIHH